MPKSIHEILQDCPKVHRNHLVLVLTDDNGVNYVFQKMGEAWYYGATRATPDQSAYLDHLNKQI